MEHILMLYKVNKKKSALRNVRIRTTLLPRCNLSKSIGISVH